MSFEETKAAVLEAMDGHEGSIDDGDGPRSRICDERFLRAVIAWWRQRIPIEKRQCRGCARMFIAVPKDRLHCSSICLRSWLYKQRKARR